MPKIPTTPISYGVTRSPFWRTWADRVAERLAGRTAVHLPRRSWSGEGEDPPEAGLPVLHYLGRDRQNSWRQVPDQWVVMGNHRDAWVYGAVDPSSGTAAMLESCPWAERDVAEGWKPDRTSSSPVGTQKRKA